MAAMLKPLSFFFILLTVNSLLFIEAGARPFSAVKPRNSASSRAIESFFDGLSLGELKQSGPSPGVGNSFTNSQTLGGIKDAGPSPCCGNNFYKIRDIVKGQDNNAENIFTTVFKFLV
ncbi:uncharacterized protein [Populus alba]|uniref:uncharacterized protein n=1 Tax=Populus alba TaxID=43335 RepID=UPI001588F70A|nr:PAMP-induced secreted peptide 2-like [Populus alba]